MVRSQQQPPAVPGNVVDDPPLLPAPALAVEYIAVDSGLELVLQRGKGVEAEAEEALAIPVSDGTSEDVA